MPAIQLFRINYKGIVFKFACLVRNFPIRVCEIILNRSLPEFMIASLLNRNEDDEPYPYVYAN